MNFFRFLSFAFLLIILCSCASYSDRARHSRNLFERGEYDLAAEYLKPFAAEKDNDELLYWMDLGIIYHTAGKYKEAISAFTNADKLAEINDYTSISLEAASYFVTDTIKTYKGENFEKILIHVYLAIDYTLLGEWDSALVECRRVNQKLEKMIEVAKLPYEKNAFAKYLAASLFETRNELNDAFVDFRMLKKWGVEFPYLAEPLLRVTDKLKALEELSQYKKDYPNEKNWKFNKNEGEVVLIVEQGRAPIKYPKPGFEMIPVFRKNYYNSDFVWLRDEEGKLKNRSYPLYDIESTAIRDLEAKAGAIIARKVGGLVTKAALATGIGIATKSEDLGALAFVAMLLTEKADLRSWSLLPAKLHLARLKVPTGRRNIVLDLVNNNGMIENVKKFENVEIKPGKQTYLVYRTKE